MASGMKREDIHIFKNIHKTHEYIMNYISVIVKTIIIFTVIHLFISTSLVCEKGGGAKLVKNLGNVGQSLGSWEIFGNLG